MKTHTVYSVILILMLAFMPGAVLAQEAVVDNDIGVNARSMGMGGAQIGAVNDVSAIVYNPAALARLQSTEIQFGVNMLKHSTDTVMSSSRGTGDASGVTDYSGLGSIGFAYPVATERGSLVFGVGLHRVKDFTERYRIDGYNDYQKGYQKGEMLEEGGMNVASFASAIDVSPNVSVGASIDVWYGNYKRYGRNVINDTDDVYSQIDIEDVDTDISAWSFKPSVLYFTDAFRLGAFVRLPMTFHLKEKTFWEWSVMNDGYFYNLYDIPDPTLEYDGADGVESLSYEIKAPMQFGMGMMWGTPGYSSIAVDVVHEDWSQAKITYPASYLPEPNYFRDKYRSAFSWRVGGEKHIPFLDIVARAGYLRQPLTFKGPRGYESGDPAISVSNERDYITLGAGKTFDQSLSLDVSYVHGFWSQDEEPRKDDENIDFVNVTLTYRLPSMF